MVMGAGEWPHLRVRRALLHCGVHLPFQLASLTAACPNSYGIRRQDLVEAGFQFWHRDLQLEDDVQGQGEASVLQEVEPHSNSWGLYIGLEQPVSSWVPATSCCTCMGVSIDKRPETRLIS